MAKKNVLGRGLGALIADAAEEPVTREIVVSAIQELNLAVKYVITKKNGFIR